MASADAQEITAAVSQTYAGNEQAVAPAAPVAEVAAATEIISVPILTQYHSQDEQGQYQVCKKNFNLNFCPKVYFHV